MDFNRKRWGELAGFLLPLLCAGLLNIIDRTSFGQWALWDLTLSFFLLNLLRVMKYSFVTPGGAPARYLWYAYYIPLTFGPR